MSKPVPPDPGIGYRLLRSATRKHRGEQIKPGDEFLHGGGWYVTSIGGEYQGCAGRDKWRRRRTDESIPTHKLATAIATKIVKDLFTDGSGRIANRLVLELPGEKFQGGGYCPSAIHSVILRALKGEL